MNIPKDTILSLGPWVAYNKETVLSEIPLTSDALSDMVRVINKKLHGSIRNNVKQFSLWRTVLDGLNPKNLFVSFNGIGGYLLSVNKQKNFFRYNDVLSCISDEMIADNSCVLNERKTFISGHQMVLAIQNRKNQSELMIKCSQNFKNNLNVCIVSKQRAVIKSFKIRTIDDLKNAIEFFFKNKESLINTKVLPATQQQRFDFLKKVVSYGARFGVINNNDQYIDFSLLRKSKSIAEILTGLDGCYNFNNGRNPNVDYYSFYHAVTKLLKENGVNVCYTEAIQ